MRALRINSAAVAEAAAVASPEILRPASVASLPKVQKKAARQFPFATVFGLAFAAAMAGIIYGNQAYGPEMYATNGMVPAAEAHAQGKNYAVFDLNLNVRALREAQLKRMTKTPELIILGASQWQEGHKELLRGLDVFNAHIHRDYWEDFPGMVELLVRYDRLPKKLIVAIRDKQFTPVEARKDWLWEPGIPAYRAMTRRLGIETESYVKTAPYHRLQALISLPMLFENFTRWYNAPEHPGPTTDRQKQKMDMIMPDGSIVWSSYKKLNVFSAKRTASEVDALVTSSLSSPLLIDPKGVAAYESVFAYLKSQGVQVYLTNPPYNPDFYDRIVGTPFAEGVARIDALTHKFSNEFGFPVFGNFNPHKAGCTSDMYIDAEHSSPQCLQKVFDQFLALDGASKAN